MIKIYSMPTCPYCDYLKPQVAGNPNFEVVNIASHVSKMHEFMDLRDHNPAFDHAKAIGDIGIPAFLLEDGTVTLDPAEVGLKEWTPGTPVNGAATEGASCSLDGKGC